MYILIIRPGAIGDALLAFPVIHALRTRYPHAHITLVSNAAILPLARDCGIADEVSDYGSAQWSELFLTARSRTSALQNLLQRTHLAICWLRDSDGIVAHNLHTAGIKKIIIAPGRPTMDERIHITQYLAQTADVQNIVDAHWLLLIRRKDIASPITINTNFSTPIAIHPGSGGANKCWPITHFATIITRLWQHNIPTLLLAGPADHERLTTLLSYLPSPQPSALLKIFIDVPLLEVAQLLQQCRGYLGNDSGITHLAGMLGIPTIALFGPSDPLIWQPPGPTVTVLSEPLLANLHTDRVFSTLEMFCL